MRPPCSIAGCDSPNVARGWCEKHYNRWKRHGDPLNPGRVWPGKAGEEARFWSKVDKTPTCWEWTGARVRGYGVFTLAGHTKMVKAHRYAYELLVEPIPDGLVIDHLCRNTGCVNPAHLEPVTDRVNLMRGEGPSAVAARKTHCKRGHEFTPENTRVRKVTRRRADGSIWVGSGRGCRACERLRWA